MADKVLTRVQGGVTDTIHINTDKFAGVRTMSRGYVYPTIFDSSYSFNGVTYTKTDEETFSLVASNSSGNFNLAILKPANGIRLGKHRITCDVAVNSGSISSLSGYYNDVDSDPALPNVSFFNFVEGSNVIDFEIFEDGNAFDPQLTIRINPESTCDISVTNFKVTHEPSTLTVDRTAQVVTSDRKGESRPLLSKVVGGASAAYSLRDLNDKAGNNKVVRVRRASDNTEKDFRAKEVKDITKWVNAQVVPPLDVRELVDGERTGALIPAAAAYSLRNLGSGFIEFVVDVRRSSDNALEAFSAAQVADGTLEDFVNVGKDYVGYARFQDSTTSNVNLTSSFKLEATNHWSIKFGYIAGSTHTGLFGLSGNGNTGFWFGNLHAAGITDDSGYFNSLNFSSAKSLTIGQHHEIEFFNTPAEGVRVIVDGVTMSGAPKIYGDITLNKIGISRGRDGERVIENVRIDLNGDGTLDYSYAGDGNQASNWTDRVGSNNGTPTAQVLTYNNEYTDGFVTRWYDQSGNGNHANQANAASQPKIVEAGSLLNEIKFDGVDDFMLSDVSTSGDDTTVLVAKNNSTTSGSLFLDNQSVGPKALYVTSTKFQAYYGATSDLNYGSLNNDENLHFISTNATDSNNRYGSLNGIVDLLDAGTRNYSALSIGISRTGSSPLNGSIKELIIYNSDQTDNRTAFEANIGETYGIDLPSGVDTGFDQVDGFVETWYDQSGNGNHAVQATAGSQPKIVESGQVKDHLLFDGTNSYLALTTPVDFDDGSGFFTVKGDASDPSQTLMGGHSSTNYLPLLQNNNTGNQYTNSMTVSSEFVNGNQQTWADRDDAFDAVITNNYVLASFIDINNASGALLKDIGRGAGLTTWVFKGEMKEVILYTSDQSANRVAIETNINNQYDIY